MARHNDLGTLGEDLAVHYLQGKGYQILERNYRFDRAEIDIIAKKTNTLISVEVKTRSSLAFGNPQDFLKPKQMQRLIKAMNDYVIRNDFDVEVRFDVINRRPSYEDLSRLVNSFSGQ